MQGQAIKRERYSVPEAAKLIGVSRFTLWRWIRGNKLPAIRLGKLWFVYGGDLRGKVIGDSVRGVMSN